MVYLKNGQLSFDTPYVDGKLHGIRKSWYENGKLQCEESYVDGKLSKRKEWEYHIDPYYR